MLLSTRLLLSLVIEALFHITNCQELRITPPGRQIKTAGTGIIFTCNLSNVSHDIKITSIRWQDPYGKWIESTKGRVYVERDGSRNRKLYIKDISESDSGVYTCQAEVLGVEVTAEASIVLFEDVEFGETEQSLTHIKGSNPLLPCTATGQPEPQITWRFQRKKLVAPSLKYRYEENGLRVFNIDENDNGTYECRAEVLSQATLKIRLVQLNVLYEPKFVQRLRDTTVIQGQNITLKCEAIGNPQVTYTWYKEESVRKGVKMKMKLGQSTTKTTHHIADATPRDEGLYFCLVENDQGKDEVKAALVVLVPPEIAPLPHKLHKEHDHLEISCQARGVPTPEVVWYRVGNHEKYREGEQKSDPRITMDNTQEGRSKLIIQDISKADAGLYTCIAKNKAGETRKNASVVVQYAPEMLTEGKSTYLWEDGHKVTLNCTADSVPIADITWYKGKHFLETNATYQISGTLGQSTLTVTYRVAKDWIYGRFVCNAKNIQGRKQTEFHILQPSIPVMPRNVTVTSSMTTISLDAPPPPSKGDLPLERWIIWYRLPKQKQRIGELYLMPDEPLVISNLTADTEYIVFISAQNAIGLGREAKFKVRTKDHDAPIDPPYNSQPGRHDSSGLYSENGVVDKKGYKVQSSTEKSKGDFTALLMVVMAIVLISLVVLTASVVVFSRRRKRANNSNHDRNSKDIDMMQLNIQRKESPTPTAAHRVYLNNSTTKLNGTTALSLAPPPIPDHTATLPLRHNGHHEMERPMSDIPTINCVAATQSAEQQAAWNIMMHQAELETSDEVEEEEEEEEVEMAKQALPPIMMTSGGVTNGENLPPPPDFLLDSYHESQTMPPTDFLYGDILDGYHSGDNIDYPDDLHGRSITGDTSMYEDL